MKQMLNLDAKLIAPMPVRHYGDPVLRQKATAIPSITPEVQELAMRMVATMYEDDGVGLAAPQVGVSLRLITIGTNAPGAVPDDQLSAGEKMLQARMPVVLVNPEIVATSDERECADEGCLSIPGIYGEVERPARVVVRGQLLSGEMVQVDCGGLLARCLQHEVDHLNGVLFVDHLSRDETKACAAQLRALGKQTIRELNKSGL